MISDITHVGGAQQGIANGMYQHIGIAVAQQSQFIIYLDSSQPQVAVNHQLVDIISNPTRIFISIYNN